MTAAGALIAVALVPAAPPVVLGRDQAADLARQELANPAYHQADQPLLLRLLQWVIDRVADVVNQVGANSPGGWLGVLGLVVVLVAAVTVVRWRMGPVRRTAGTERAVFDTTAAERSAAEHRAMAEAAAARGDWASAVRERLRALVRGLEERGLLDPRPARTAAEAAAEAGAVLPEAGAALREGALVFDEVCYGGRPGSRSAYDVLVRTDRAVSAARPAPAAALSSAGGGFTAVPR